MAARWKALEVAPALVEKARTLWDRIGARKPRASEALLPEQALIAPGTPGLPADFPLAEVPLVGSRVLEARTAAIDGWSVTVEVAGDDVPAVELDLEVAPRHEGVVGGQVHEVRPVGAAVGGRRLPAQDDAANARAKRVDRRVRQHHLRA